MSRDVAGKAEVRKQQAASNKPQAKSKKGAHLSAGPSPAWRDRDFVRLCGLPATIGIVLSSRFSVLSCAPRNLSAVTVASLMLQRVTAFPLHLGTVWSSWTDLFSTQWPVAKWLAAQQLNVAWRSSVADCATSLGTGWSLWTGCFKSSGQWPVASSTQHSVGKEKCVRRANRAPLSSWLRTNSDGRSGRNA
jgi:hypothetical protein